MTFLNEQNNGSNNLILLLKQNGNNIKLLKEKIELFRKETILNNEMNKKTRDVLTSLNINNKNHNINNNSCSITNNKTALNHNKRPIYNYSKSNCFHSSKLKYNHNYNSNNQNIYTNNYINHTSYWKPIWIFTDNPIYEYGNFEGFENPYYRHLFNSKENQFDYKSYNSKLVSNSGSSIETELHQEYFYNKNEEYCISDTNEDKEETDSAIDLIESYLTDYTISSNNSSKHHSFTSCSSSSIGRPSTSSTSSSFYKMNIYESISDMNNHDEDAAKNIRYSECIEMSSPDSGIINSVDNINQQTSNNDDFESLYSTVIKSKIVKKKDEKYEQDEMPMGWIKCCDDMGTYYWHKPTGTVTRIHPSLEQQDDKILVKLAASCASSSSSSTSTSSVSKLEDEDHNNHHTYECLNLQEEIEHPTKSKIITPNFSSSSSSSTSSTSSSSSTLEKQASKKNHNNMTRYYVRSMGWVKIDENDLTPERSSRAVNKCINDLSKGTRDLNDAAAKWGEGKDLYLDLQDNYLLLIDPIDEKILNKQSITSIRVWGVGRGNGGRDFAYVARDKQTQIHMCHVFRCDSAPAKEIANSLKESCRRIINERKLQQSQLNNILKRPNFLPETTNTTNNKANNATTSISSSNNSKYNLSSHRKMELNMKLKSIDLINENVAEKQLINNFNNTDFDEPKKTVKCKYLGSILVSKPTGINILNDAIEKIYSNSFEEYKRVRKQIYLNKMIKSHNTSNEDDEEETVKLSSSNQDLENLDDNMLDINSDNKFGIRANVIVTPASIMCVEQNDPNKILVECRIRYLSFMGIANDVRLCGFIMHNVDNTFKCHAFLCEETSGSLCKMIEAACKIRYQKCLDAHPDTSSNTPSTSSSQQLNTNRIVNNNSIATSIGPRLNNFGNQLKSMFDSFKTRGIFSNSSSSSSSS